MRVRFWKRGLPRSLGTGSPSGWERGGRDGALNTDWKWTPGGGGERDVIWEELAARMPIIAARNFLDDLVRIMGFGAVDPAPRTIAYEAGLSLVALLETTGAMDVAGAVAEVWRRAGSPETMTREELLRAGGVDCYRALEVLIGDLGVTLT